MRKKIIIWTIVLVIAFLLYKKCSVDRQSRDRLQYTTAICDKIYVENFVVFASGASGGDLRSDWLTDSLNFRIYVGSYDDAHGGLTYKCSGDTIYYTQLVDSFAGQYGGTKFYKISELLKKNNINDY